MRKFVLSLLAFCAIGGDAAADPVPSVSPVLSFGSLAAAAQDARTESTRGFIASGDRDLATAIVSPEVRPLRRPASGTVPTRRVAAVPASAVQRKITRLPWTTGVYQ